MALAATADPARQVSLRDALSATLRSDVDAVIAAACDEGKPAAVANLMSLLDARLRSGVEVTTSAWSNADTRLRSALEAAVTCRIAVATCDEPGLQDLDDLRALVAAVPTTRITNARRAVLAADLGSAARAESTCVIDQAFTCTGDPFARVADLDDMLVATLGSYPGSELASARALLGAELAADYRCIAAQRFVCPADPEAAVRDLHAARASLGADIDAAVAAILQDLFLTHEACFLAALPVTAPSVVTVDDRLTRLYPDLFAAGILDAEGLRLAREAAERERVRVAPTTIVCTPIPGCDVVSCTTPSDSTCTGLAGDPNSPAHAAVHDIEYDDELTGFGLHPHMGLNPVSYDTLAIVFADDATVADANGFLADFDAHIVGAIAPLAPGKPAFLVVRLPTTDHAAMDAEVVRANLHPAIGRAVQDIVMGIQAFNEALDFNWRWEIDPDDGNWGMELIRAPAAWNVVWPAAGRSAEPVVVGIIDNGFQLGHPDLAGLFLNVPPPPPPPCSGPPGLYPPFGPTCLSGESEFPAHGTHVAGTIGARHDASGLGVDGVVTSARLVALRMGSWWANNMKGVRRLSRDWGARVVNLSLGMDLRDAAGTDISGDPQIQDHVRWMAWQMRLLLDSLGDARPILVAAAGNDGLAAQWASEWNYLAIVDKIPGIYCVEWLGAPVGGASPGISGLSNFGGTHGAPGDQIYSTVPGGWNVLSGTSMAAPHLTGEIAFLLSVEPSLTNSDIHHLVSYDTSATNRSHEPPVLQPSGGAKFVSLFDAMLAIDFLKGNHKVVRRLCDIDDGTLDGNQRVDSGGNEVTDDAHGDPEHVVDMRDFRRWRDWVLQLEGAAHLDGSPKHFKRDLNGTGGEPDGVEDVWPLGDFNGSGSISRAAPRHVHAFTKIVDATDLDVLETVFSDPNYDKDELEGLIDSADVHVSAFNCYDDPEVVRVTATILVGGDSVDSRELSHVGGEEILTIAAPGDDSAQEIEVHIEAFAGDGTVVSDQIIRGPVHRGEDVYTGGCYQLKLEGEVLTTDDPPVLTNPDCPRDTLLEVVVLGGGLVTDASTIDIDGTVLPGPSAQPGVPDGDHAARVDIDPTGWGEVAIQRTFGVCCPAADPDDQLCEDPPKYGSSHGGDDGLGDSLADDERRYVLGGPPLGSLGGRNDGTSAGSWGDPHITTHDGVAYTSLALAEVIYATSPTPGALAVQVRQARLPGFAVWASFNVAIAVRAAGRVFQVELPRNGDGTYDVTTRQRPTLLLDGVEVDLAPGSYMLGPDLAVNVGVGGSLTLFVTDPASLEDDGRLRVDIGTRAESGLLRPDADPDEAVPSLDVRVSGRGNWRGLLGTPDGNPFNEFLLPNGINAYRPSPAFIAAWTVDDVAESLFTYAAESHRSRGDKCSHRSSTRPASRRSSCKRARLWSSTARPTRRRSTRTSASRSRSSSRPGAARRTSSPTACAPIHAPVDPHARGRPGSCSMAARSSNTATTSGSPASTSP